MSDNERPMQPLDPESLECLNFCPDDTQMHDNDREVLARLVALCNRYGYGRVPQLAAWIEEVWRDPVAARKKFEGMKREHLEMLTRARAAAREYEASKRGT